MRSRISKAAMLVMALAGVVQATLVTDSFNRDTTVQTNASNPNLIGTNYTIVSGSWLTSSAAPGYLQASAAGAMIDTTLALTNDFTVKLTVLHPNYAASLNMAGVVLNYQNPSNCYIIRWGNQTSGSLGVIQVVKYVNGASSTISVVSNLTMMAGGSYYDWTIASVGDTVSYTVTTTNDVPTTIYSGSFTDSTFSGGYFGFSRLGSSTVRFDEYSLEVVPEPTPLSLFIMTAIGIPAARRMIRKG